MAEMKLTEKQNTWRKAQKAIAKSAGAQFASDKVGGRVAIWRPKFKGANTGDFTMAIKHPNDTYSRKYGEYVALCRLDLECSCPMDGQTWFNVFANFWG